MRKGGGHEKGADFERKVCKQLSLWISRGKRDDLLWRTALSGGRATMQRRKGATNKSQGGDIGAISAMGEWLTSKFVLECKHMKNLGFMTFLNGGGELSLFLKKLRGECQGNQQPLLIAKQNNYPVLMMTTSRGAELLGFYDHLHKLGIKDHDVRLAYIHRAYVTVFLFDDFLEHIRCPRS